MIDTERLKYLTKGKFLRERPVMVIGDCPLDLEMKNKAPYSSQSANMLFSELGKVGIPRLQIHASYLFNFRPEKGDLSALFHSIGLPVSEYTNWQKKDAILNFAYQDLINLREEIAEVKPSLIICTGRWALYFLSGETTLAETKKSPWGTLLKWRASHLKLSEFWQFTDPHVLMPILPQQAVWNLPEYGLVIKQDYLRTGIVGKAAIKGNVYEYTEEAQGYEFMVSSSFEETKQFLLTELLALEENEKYYAVDVETRHGYHDCVGIATSSSRAICIPWSTTTTATYWNEAEEIELNHLVVSFLNHPNCLQIGQNYWYDMQYFWRDFAVKTKPAIDTMVQQHTMFAGMDKNLAFLCSMYAKYYRYWKDEGKTHTGKTDKDRWIYNCKDCCWTFEIAQVMNNMLKASPVNIQKAYKFQLEKTLPTLVNMMNRGVRANRAKKSELSKALAVVCGQTKEDIDVIIGEPFNPNSPAQKQALFYDLFAMPKQYDPKTKRVSCGAAALDTFFEKFPLLRPLIYQLQEYAKLNKIRTTVIDSGLDEDNRFRTSYNMCGTDTFRLSSSKNAFGSGMNLQIISTGGKTLSGKVIPNCKELFIPDTGYTYFDIDLDSADLRVVVAESGASGLQQMLNEGLKPYVELMKEYYNDPTLTKHSDQYKTFKAVTHASNYLGSAGGIAARVGLLVHEVDKLQKGYFAMNPEITKWHKELKSQVFKRGWIENVFGYRKYFFNKTEPTLMQIAAAWKPQSTVGLLINQGMVAIEDEYQAGRLPVELQLQVHDSLAGQYPTDRPECEQKIIELCEIALPYPEPIVIPVDIHTSTESWAGCK